MLSWVQVRILPVSLPGSAERRQGNQAVDKPQATARVIQKHEDVA